MARVLPSHQALSCSGTAPTRPRGELRWCLEENRGLISDPSHERVKAENDWVSIDASTIEVDALWVAARAVAACEAASTSSNSWRRSSKVVCEGARGGSRCSCSKPGSSGSIVPEFARGRCCGGSSRSNPDPRRLPTFASGLKLLPYDVAAHRELLATLAAWAPSGGGNPPFHEREHLAQQLESAWREQRQLAAGGCRAEHPPVVAPKTAVERPDWPLTRRNPAAPLDYTCCLRDT